MLKDERQHWILDKLRKNKKVTLVSLSQEFSVSYDSIRRDIIELEEKGLLRKIHGAAIENSYLPMKVREEMGIPNNEILTLVKKSIRLLKNGQIVLLDGGSTNLYLAEHLPQQLEITIVTNNPPLAMSLADHPKAEVILLGGKFHKRYQITTGHEAIEQIKYLKADLYFMGVVGAHPQEGFSLRDYEESIQKRRMLASARQTVVCATTEKLNTSAAHQICGTEDVQILVTSCDANDPILNDWQGKIEII